MANNQQFTLNIKALFDASDVKSKINDLQNAFKNIKLPNDLQKGLNTSLTNLSKAINDFESRAAKGIKTKTDAKGLTSSIDSVIKEFSKVENIVDKIKNEFSNSTDLSKLVQLDDNTLQKIRDLRQEIKDLQTQIADITAGKLQEVTQVLDRIKSKGAKSGAEKAIELFNKGEIEEAIKLLDQVIAKQEQLAKGNYSDATKQTAEKNKAALTDLLSIFTNAQNEVKGLTDQVNNKTKEMGDTARQAFQQTINGANQSADALLKTGQSAQQARDGIDELGQSQASFNSEVDQLKSRIQYFFGLNNAIQLVKRTMREAYNTIKELDKAMTETAVVTDFSVGDMWAQLPEYTKRANELGVTTKAAYEAATLYYQQGLKTNEVMAISNETLKMARIAGLDAAVATDRMTNAIRGFNMEINETNTQRINDVYSRLAAISASNVDEISTAMTKVASLAHNANMEFESTAAFLAQIIETTRESAETAGTALKTVVARFSEVKKLVDEGELKGSDEEGEIIDVNKVSQALRTAGIDLNKYFLGEVGLDDIFMELASKWDSLTTLQQRYIATQAAGSRQQSRFIALMSDYARTQELVGEAYNANGASAKQFAKTQESLESKLARLKNAWNEFAMGILNSDLVKAGVDLLTNLLNGINALTSGFGSLNDGAGKFLNTFSKLAILIGGLSLGKGLAQGLFASIGGALTGNPLGAGGFTQAMLTGVKSNGLAGRLGAKGPLGAMAGLLLNPFAGVGSLVGKGAKGLWTGGQAIGNLLYGLGGATGASSLAAGGSIAGGVGAAAGIAGIATALAGVTAAAGAAYLIVKKLYDLSPQGQLKIAQKYADALSNVSDNAKSQLQEYQKVQEEYSQLNENINNATTNYERSSAIKDRNEYITSLLEQNSAYAEYLSTTFENGEIVLTLDEDKLAAAVDKIAEGAVRASAYSQMANAVAAGQQANLYRSKMSGVDLEAGTRTTTTYSNGIVSQELKRTSILTPEEIAKYTRYQSEIEASDAQMRGYVRNAAAQLLDPEALSDEVAGLVADFISRGFDSQKISNMTQTQQAENWWAGEATEAQLKAEYTRIYGTEPGKDIGRAEMARDVAFAQVMEETTEAQVDQLQELLTSDNHELYEAVLAAASGSGRINEINLDEIDLEGDTVDLYDALGINDTALANLTKTLSLTDDEFNQMLDSLTNQIVAQAKLTKEVQKVNKSKIYSNLIKAGVNIDKAVQDMIQGLTPEQAQAIADITTQASQFLSPEDFLGLINNIPQLLQSDELNQIQDFFNNFSLDDPINAFWQLREAEEQAVPDGLFDKFLKQIEETNQAILNSGNLFQTFLTNGDYDELQEDIKDFIKENDKITADNVEDLAKKCKSLRAVLEDDKISAEGLARALNELDAGNVPIEGFTERVLESLSAIEDFDTMLQEISDTIANFDPGRDYGEGSDFLVQQADNLLDLIEGYEFGNEQTRNIYDLFFGKGAYDKFMSEWGTRGVDEYAEIMKGQIESFKEWAQTNSYGFMRDMAQMGQLGISFKDGNPYDFIWDTQGKTTQELITAVQETANVSREAAEMLIEGFAAQSYDFANELKANDYTAWLSEFSTKASETRTITEQELQVLGAAFGKTSDEIYADLEKLHNEQGIDIPVRVNWQDEKGNLLSGDALIDRFKESLGTINWTQYVQDSINQDTGNIDASSLMDSLTADGLDPSQAEQIANTIVSEIDGAMLEKTISVPKLAEDGITVTAEDIHVAADSMEALTAAENAAIEAANYDLVASSIASQDLSGLETNLDGVITRSAENLTSQMNAACTAVDASGVGTAITNAGTVAAGNLQQIIANTPFYGTVVLQATVSGSGSGALGGIVKSYANGTDSSNHSLTPGWALTGEEGPEIVWNKQHGYSYITGGHGPEFRTLYPGDRVFNAAETRRILANSSFANGGIFGSYARGGYNPNRVKDDRKRKDSGSGSDSDSNSTPTIWENELDWLYNLVEDISELERTQTKLAEKHDRYLNDISKTGRDLYNVSQQQLNNLYTQRDNQREMLTRRRQEMAEQIGISGYGNYVKWNDRDQTIEIDWNAIEAIQDKDTYDEVTDLISKVEKIQDEMDDAQDALWDIEGQIKEIEQRYLEEFTEFQDRVMDAVVHSYQEQIDNLESLNDTLNDTNASILESLQQEIEYSRQIRDNTDTEKNIADMEARLAYLRRDTTGGNAAEIRDLEKQLEDARQSYEDTLIDQSIEKLSEANEKAAEQRQQQIDLMTAQLEYWQESGALWAEVAELMAGGISESGSLIRGSELETTLANAENWKAMSQQQREVWANDLITATNQAGAYIIKMAEGFDSLSAGIWAMLPSSSVTSQKLQYATGGLNKQTGWAWLDGTANEPEYVLNARQTDAFMRLAEVLPAMFNGGAGNMNNVGGNIYVDLKMDVGSIASDYDVDRLVERVKTDIYNASSYRNVNAVSFLR